MWHKTNLIVSIPFECKKSLQSESNSFEFSGRKRKTLTGVVVMSSSSSSSKNMKKICLVSLFNSEYSHFFQFVLSGLVRISSY